METCIFLQPGYDYRAAICKSLPQIKILDDEPATLSTSCGISSSGTGNSTGISSNKKSACVFDADWALINELIAEGDLLTNEDSPSPAPLRPGSGSASRPLTGYRPGSALRPTTAGRRLADRRDEEYRPLTAIRPGTGAARLGTGVRPTTGFRPNTASWVSPGM